MYQPATHLVINWLYVENNEILVGATDNDRWEHDTADGMSGADATTIVLVTLHFKRKLAAVETAKLHCWPGDANRELAISKIQNLFDIAWKIKDNKMTHEDAREKFFGKEIQ